MATKFKLCSFKTCPWVHRAAIVLQEKGIEYDLEYIDRDNRPDWFLAISPHSKVPVLIVDEDRALFESNAIAEYLDELTGGKLIPASGPAKWQAKTDHSILQGMLDALLLCRYEKMLRPKEFLWAGWADDHFKRAGDGLARYEAHPDVLTRPLDIVQISIVCVLGYLDFRFPDCGWRKTFPKLDAFHEKMMQRVSVKTTLPPPA